MEALLIAALLVLALGFCVFESGHLGNGHHAKSFDLCTGLVLVLPTVVILVRPFLSGWAMLDLIGLLSTPSAQLLDPPPRIASPA